MHMNCDAWEAAGADVADVSEHRLQVEVESVGAMLRPDDSCVCCCSQAAGGLPATLWSLRGSESRRGVGKYN